MTDLGQPMLDTAQRILADLASEARGAEAVAETFKGRARGATPARINGDPGAVWMVSGQTRSAFVFTVEHDRIVAIDLIMDPSRLLELDVDIVP